MVRVAVIGAGAAGISAGRTLVAAGHEAVIYEARDRVGGRVYTDTELAGHPVELGAEFVHGARVTTWEWIRDLGVPTTGAAHAYEMWFHLHGRLLDRAAAVADFGTDPLTVLGELMQRWVESGRPEASLDHVFELWPEASGQPLTDERRNLIANYMSELAASDLEDLSTGRLASYAGQVPETLRHFRLLDGYTDLANRAVAGLDVRLNTPVTRVRWDDTSVEVQAGDTVERFDRAIVALPLGVLRRRLVTFEPELPAEKQRAIDGLNLGHISKVILRFDRVYWPLDLTFLWTPLSTQLWWRPGQGQPSESAVLTAYFGGRAAAELEEASAEEAAAEATHQLGDILGQSLVGHVLGSRYIAWGAEPYMWMGYSSVPVGGRGLRQALAEPVGALSFAGEATSPDHPATVHGAIETGRRAASEAVGGF